MADSRTKNTSRNIAAGLVNRFASIFFTFFNRTIIIYLLGAEFSGLNSLFTSILGMLSLAELGVHTAIVQSMYEPIAKNDKRRICELITLYKKLYRIAGFVIFGIGVLLIPFLPYLIKGQIPEVINLYRLYVLYLFNTVISYFMFSYKGALLLAHQRHDVSQKISTVLMIIKAIVQMVILLVLRNFYAYLMIEIVSTISSNLWVAKETEKRYPEYQCVKEKVKLTEDIKKQMSGLMVGKLCDKARNSLDSIILSMFLGLTTIAIYDNYYYIYSALYGIMLVVCNSMGASVGNSIATETLEKNYDNLQKFSFLVAWISGWISICMLCLYQPFMKIWMGEGLMLSNFNMLLFCVYFYAINMNNIRNQFIGGAGLWWYVRTSNLAEAIANICLNIILGKLFGITGIILATIITIFAFNFLWRTIILFNTYFKGMSLKKLLLNHFNWFICVVIAAAVTYGLCGFIQTEGILKLVLNGIVCVIIPNGILFLLWFRTKEFKESKVFILRMFKVFKK